jgi:asparagine synthase (glutamine-hydrolysing)
MGGDELMALRPSEDRSPRRQPPAVPWLGSRTLAARPEIEVNTAPVSPVPLATLVALAVRNPTYLREGIWPVSPLADPALVRFAESLPVSWRAGTALLKERLRRVGLPPEVVQPRRPENFLALMHSGLRRYGLPLARDMLRGSLLIDNGYVDGGAFSRALHQAEIPDVLYDTVALEFGIRTLWEAAHGAGDGESALSAARSL